MKKYFTSILFLLAVQHLSAFNLFDQLCTFNANWKKYEGRIPLQQAFVFNADKDYVQAHLSSVLTILQTNSVSDLSAAQYSSRMHLIALLDQYRIAGNFPINYNCRERIPVFIDRNNTHCAVGYLLQQTGYEEVALRIAAADNYAWVKDITDTALPAWQKSSGLSLEELKLIQGAYDFYMPNAFILPNKYEIPQKPACITAYFEHGGKKDKVKHLWCHGEGTNGILNGRWEQNYSATLPWIVGYFDNGKRTGQWLEYYQGTKLLCRTENWRDDKLNGIRKRFDRSGKLVEEILFKDGKAVTKTNYDLAQSLTWVRKPIDSTLVFTEVYTTGGGLVAAGQESVYNPGNLLWFQNIELTALNSAAITSREILLPGTLNNGISQLRPHSFRRTPLYNTPPLVEYKKEGEWMYYKDCRMNNFSIQSSGSLKDILCRNYYHFGETIFQSLRQFTDLKITNGYDSIRIIYANNLLQDFYGYGTVDYAHLIIRYHRLHFMAEMPSFVRQRMQQQPPAIMECGQYNKDNQKIAEWKHYDRWGRLYKTENFILPETAEDKANELSAL